MLRNREQIGQRAKPFEQLGPGSRKKHGRWRVSDPIDLPLLRRLHVNAAEGLSEMTLNVIKS